MSHFSETLQALMALDEEGLNQLTLAERAGISQATISRLLAGREPTKEQVGKLCAVISQERSRRVELLLADLRDRARASKIAGIDERHYRLSAVSEEANGNLPGTLNADLQLLADEAALHEDIREMIGDFVQMIVRHRAEVADAAGALYPFHSGVGAAVAESPLADKGTTDPFGAAVAKEGARRSHAKRETKSS